MARLVRTPPAVALVRALSAVVVLTLLTGCAILESRDTKVHRWYPVARCPEDFGTTRAARINVLMRDLDDKTRAAIENALTVTVACETATYDPVTEQGRWPYRVTLEGANTSPTYTFHFSKLVRKVTNFLVADPTADTRATNVQEFKLDVLRAQVEVGPGPMSFPCAETLTSPPRLSRRVRTGLFIVERTYSGDVVVEPALDRIAFVPVEVTFEIHFTLPAWPGPMADDAARRHATRMPEWGAVSDRCETCKPIIICESLQAKSASSWSWPIPATYEAPAESRVHLMLGLEKRHVTMNDVLALLKHSVACTRWTPAGQAGPPPNWTTTEGNDDDVPAATPYVILHQSHAAQPGCWDVELRLGDIYGPSTIITEAARSHACDASPTAFSLRVFVPDPSAVDNTVNRLACLARSGAPRLTRPVPGP